MVQKSTSVAEISAALRAADIHALPRVIKLYRDDPRQGVVSAVEVARRRLAAARKEIRRSAAMYDLQRTLDPDGTRFILGIDEVGRGAVAGPLTVAAVALPLDRPIDGLDDSKRLTPERREELAQEIHLTALVVKIVHVPAEEIDLMGMSLCLRAAVMRAILGVEQEPHAVLIDGTPLRAHPRERAIIKGDGSEACIAAASIVAKVARDALMRELDPVYPGYGFAASKGYASPEHIQQIKTVGLTEVHRATFCTGFLEESLF